MKAGADDYLVAHGPEALGNLLKTAWPFNPAWDNRMAEIAWQTRDLTPESLLTDKLKVLSNLVPTLARMTELDRAVLLEELRERLKLRGADLAGLKADIKTARKSKEAKDKKDKRKFAAVNDLEEGFRIHPAIDFLGDAMSIGFRVNLPDNETGLLLVISDGQGVWAEVNPETVGIGERAYQVIQKIAPPFLQDVWNLDRLKAFLKHPTKPQNLYRMLVETLKIYLDLPEPAYGLLAVWAIATYFSHLFTAFSFLYFHGPKESGKSKTLEALRYVCFNAWKGRDITAAALGDTTDGLRGTLLLDQAEKLNQEHEGNLIGLLADSYKKAGGQRRVVDNSKAGRRVLEFATYGPKAFASTRRLDPDIEDRCVKIPMTRTRKKLPDLEGWERVWTELRDKLYRFVLATFREVEAAYKAIPGDGTRIGELWRPLGAVLQALAVPPEEAAAVRELFVASAQETRHEPTASECVLLEMLREEARVYSDKFEMTVTEILKAMNIEGPDNKWVGDMLSHYHLFQGRRRAKVDGKKQTAYLFDPARVKELCEIYLRDTPQNDLSRLSPDDNSNDSNGFQGTREKPGTRPHLSPLPPDNDEPTPPGHEGHEGSCPPKITCPPYLQEITNENAKGTGGQAQTGGIEEKKSQLLKTEGGSLAGGVI